MANVTKPNTFTPNSTISSSDVNDNFDTIYNEFNGSISAANLADNAVTTAKITDGNVTAAKIASGTITPSLLTSTFQGGWQAGVLPAVSSVTYNGNRSYDVTFASTVASYLTPGMRARFTRTVAAPTQCTSLNGSTQYYSKSSPSGMTFTNNFVVSAWIKLSSYAGATIASRYSSASGGWIMSLSASGQVQLQGFNGGSVNQRYIQSYQSVPLNKWVHVTAQLDMSSSTNSPTVNYTMIDGVDVPCVQTSLGSAPTTLTQAGNLEIGSQNGGSVFFPGKIAQVAIYNAKVTQATIRTSMSQTLTGSETSLISAYSFNNSINDLSANANNLTANGSAVATNADSPFSQDSTGTIGSYDYGIVTKVATTVATIQVPEGCAIPTSGGVSAVDLGTGAVQFGFPKQKNRWQVELNILSTANSSGGVVGTVYNPGGLNVVAPTGDWDLISDIEAQQITATATVDYYVSISTSSSAFTIAELTAREFASPFAAAINRINRFHFEKSITATTATPYYVLMSPQQTSSTLAIRGAAVSTNTGESSRIVLNLSYL